MQYPWLVFLLLVNLLGGGGVQAVGRPRMSYGMMFTMMILEDLYAPHYGASYQI